MQIIILFCKYNVIVNILALLVQKKKKSPKVYADIEPIGVQSTNTIPITC